MVIKEFFNDSGCDLKEVLKECISGYYEKYKNNELYALSNKDSGGIIDNINKKALSTRKENSNVHWKCNR